MRFSAIQVFHDPRNWALDGMCYIPSSSQSYLIFLVQIACDILLAGGIVGGPRLSPGNPLYNSVELVFCNPDLLWRSDFEQPRLGQGGFKEALLSVHKVEVRMVLYDKRTNSILGFDRFGIPICSVWKAHNGNVQVR